MSKMIFFKVEDLWLIGVGEASSINKMFDGEILYVHKEYSMIGQFAGSGTKVSMEYSIAIDISNAEQFKILCKKCLTDMNDYLFVGLNKKVASKILDQFKKVIEVGKSMFSGVNFEDFDFSSSKSSLSVEEILSRIENPS